MEFLFSKVAPLLVYPLNLFFVLAVTSAALYGLRRRLAARLCLAAGFVMLLMVSLPPVATRLYGSLEQAWPAVPIAQLPAADAIVVLGGALGEPIPPRRRIELTGSSDRVWYAVELYRAGKAPRIVVSGGNVFPQRAVRGEAVYIVRLLRDWGVPQAAIVFEAMSRNTYQNARATRRLLARRGLRQVLLVTSAYHMRRALATFRSAGIDAVPATTDIRIVDTDAPAVFDWIPTAGALALSTAALSEYLGFVYYRWRGWIQPGKVPL